jgi:hypothetical protein
MNPRKKKLTWFHLGCSITLLVILAASAGAVEPAYRHLAAGPNWGGGVGTMKSATSVPVKPLPAVSPPTAASKPAGAPVNVPSAEPKWPQPFELGAGERTGFGFVAGKPGPIVVNVQWTGVPLTVSLAKPGGGTVDRQGNGSVTLQYNATADDVQRGMIWGISIRPAQESPKQAGGSGIAVFDRPIKQDIRILAKGSVSVQHPPGDMKLAQAELNARAAQAKAAQARPQQTNAAQANILTQRQTALQKQNTARQAALLEQVRQKIPVQAYQQASQRIAIGGTPGAVSSQSSAITAAPGIPVERGTGIAIGGKSFGAVSTANSIGTSSQALSDAGSNPPATTVADPAIASLSAYSGQPGDPVLITGSNFSNDPGEVHFIVANGMDVKAQPTAWNDTQIFTSVPDVSGIQGFSGLLYVQRGTDKSKMVTFQFVPATEFRKLGPTPDSRFKRPWETMKCYENNVYCTDSYGISHDLGILFGGRGDDEFFEVTRLKNGWQVDSAYLTSGQSSLTYDKRGVIIISPADVFISEFRQGTDSPYLKVHWWMDAGGFVAYSPRVVIKGPKGVPHF